jgi:hypothetical protein
MPEHTYYYCEIEMERVYGPCRSVTFVSRLAIK